MSTFLYVLYIQSVIILWQLQLVDTLTMLQVVINAGTQYGGIVLAAASGNFSHISPKVALEPLRGLKVAGQFIMAAQNAAERRARVATVAVALAGSFVALTMDPAANMASAAVTTSYISYWEKLRGGGSNQLSNQLSNHLVKYLIPSLKDFLIENNSIKNSVVPSLLSPAQMEFRNKWQNNCQEIMQNIVREQAARRYANGCAQAAAQKFKMIQFSPTYLVPIASTQLNTTATIALIGWTVLGVGVVIVTIGGALYLFQKEERRRYQKDEIVIDVSASIDD